MEGKVNAMRSRKGGLQLGPAQDLLQQQVKTLACWGNAQCGKIAQLHEGFPDCGLPLL